MIYIADLTIVRELDDSLRLEILYVAGDTNSNKPLLIDHMFNMEQEIECPPTCVYYNKGTMTTYIGIIQLIGFKIIPKERKIKIKAPFKIEEQEEDLSDGYSMYQKSIKSDLIFEEKDITIQNIIKKGA